MKFMRPIAFLTLFSLCLVWGSFTVQAEPKVKDGVKHVDAKDAEKLLKEKKDVTILDVRTEDEYKDGHIKKAKNINYFDDEFESKAAKLDKEKPVIVHCQSGGRSSRSLEMLKKLGFKNIYHLDGGMNAWVEAGLPVEK